MPAWQSFGSWQGLSVIRRVRRLLGEPTRNAPPGGESFAEQMRRVAAAVERLTTAFTGRAARR